MSRQYFQCPYCDEETYIDLETEKEDVTYIAFCMKCNKTFNYYFRVSIDIYPDKIKQKEEIK